MPDEIALVFYESQQDYNSAKDTIAGRHMRICTALYSVLQIRAALPVTGQRYFLACWSVGNPVVLFEKNVDWQLGHVNVLVASRASPYPRKSF